MYQMAQSPFKTKEFLKLQKQWDKKLAKSGFEDIEQDETRLKVWSAQLLRKQIRDRAESTEAYYYIATHFIYSPIFKMFFDSIDLAIWEYHAEGVTIDKTSQVLKAVNIIVPPHTVHNRIEKIREKMLKHNKFDGMYNLRAGKPEDKNFVLSSFLRGMYHGDSWFSQIPRGIFMDNYKVVAEALFDDPKNLVVVACLPEDPNIILGYSILSADGTTLHWVYVKQTWRRRGIMTRIVPNTITKVSHLTELGSTLIKKLKKDVIFNPFLTQESK